jgi:hypothetical protein
MRRSENVAISRRMPGLCPTWLVCFYFLVPLYHPRCHVSLSLKKKKCMSGSRRKLLRRGLCFFFLFLFLFVPFCPWVVVSDGPSSRARFRLAVMLWSWLDSMTIFHDIFPTKGKTKKEEERAERAEITDIVWRRRSGTDRFVVYGPLCGLAV